MELLKKHAALALLYFMLIALFGLLLRLFQLVDIPVVYKYMVHTHSHIALLGWVYTALTTLLYKLYLDHAGIARKYRKLFWGTQVTIIGMLLSFPFTGYALFSILFSTLFLIASYVFARLFFKYTSIEQKETPSYQCIRMALWYMVLSSLGPWALGAIMNTAGSKSPLYRNAIYFYLHFQYNGWFVMALLGIFLKLIEQRGIAPPKKSFAQFFWLFNGGIVATFGISLLWMEPHMGIYLVSALGALMQCLAFVILIRSIGPFWNKLSGMGPPLVFWSLKISALLFLVKLVLQFFGSLPPIAALVMSNIDFVIGYLHWTFLGVVSIALFGFLRYFRLIGLSKKALLFYLIGFGLTEGLIFYKGIAVWKQLPLLTDYFWYLALASGVLLLAIGIILGLQFSKRVG
ncbi:hypothetical protein [Spongiimicrobium sp. 2-473A-2-J]|uniref:hypothetical protein n=1 Tax=Eudoraea algarum TaxID=3417568 RepID=UPI003D359CF5